jgi:hypothetical protein
MTCHVACPPCAGCEELRRRVAELEGALLGLLSRDDFWRAVQRTNIILPAEYDDAHAALSRATGEP